VLSAVAAGACGLVSTNFDQVIGLSITNVPGTVAVGDTLKARAVALTAGGDSVSATIYWASFDTTVLAVADSTKGYFVGRMAGATAVQARTGDLRSNSFAVTVTATP